MFPDPLIFPIQNHRNLQLYTRDSCSHTNTSLLYILKSAESLLHKLDHVTINLSLSNFFVEDIIFASIDRSKRERIQACDLVNVEARQGRKEGSLVSTFGAIDDFSYFGMYMFISSYLALHIFYWINSIRLI